ncbi:MAG: hypothetical protein K5858_01265 [Lachnospiraceae bacterium]|nr:hypothetical protein [Lachnospiraceae bacterium]
MKDIVFEKDRLRLVLEVPEGNERSTLRFDAACRVKEIVLDGKYSFGTSEQIKEGRVSANGFGLSAEFSVPEDLLSLKEGEWFTKPGVGLLCQLKDGMPFYIFGDYKAKTFKMDIKQEEDGFTFTQSPETGEKETPAFPIEITKKLSVTGNKILIKTVIANAGKKDININEYQHNFFNANGKPIGPDYKMTVPFAKSLESESFIFDKTDEHGIVCGKAESPISVKGNEISWTKNVEGLNIFLELPKSRLVDESEAKFPDFYYELKDTIEGLSVRESGSFFPEKITIWGTDHVMCAENFVKISLRPGKVQTYTRVWEFDKN